MKPKECKVCPSYGLSHVMVGDAYKESKVLLLKGTMDEDFPLQYAEKLAGLDILNTSMAIAVRCKGEHSKEAIAYCHTTHFHPPACTELVIAIGPLAAKVMGMEGKIEQWRGHCL